jgi:hypothetical protein
MENIDGREYLTTDEVAVLKGTKATAVTRAIRGGRLKAIRLLGRWLILPADADAWTPGTWGDVARMKKKGGAE